MAYLYTKIEKRDVIWKETQAHNCAMLYPVASSCTREWFTLSLFIPLPELCIEESVGEALPADSDTLEDTIAPQLVEHQVSIDHTGPLQFVGDDAADKVGCGVAYSNRKQIPLTSLV